MRQKNKNAKAVKRLASLSRRIIDSPLVDHNLSFVG